MEYEFRPIVNWPGKPTPRRKRAQFKAGYSATLELLETELRMLAARQVVIQLALSDRDIRVDGRPRAGSRPSHPGVILSFQSKHGPLSYPCDTYEDWEDNLRAIALALEHLRAVDRYGVTKRGEQYKGWTQLPPPAVNGTPTTVIEALTVLADAIKRTERVSRENWPDIYRKAAMATHPDRGGTAEAFKRVQDAKEFLEKLSP